MNDDFVSIHCSICGRRLFDVDSSAEGQIRTKCTKCKRISIIKIKKKNNAYGANSRTVTRVM